MWPNRSNLEELFANLPRFVRSLLDIIPPHILHHRGESTVPKWTLFPPSSLAIDAPDHPEPGGTAPVHASVGLTLLNEFKG